MSVHSLDHNRGEGSSTSDRRLRTALLAAAFTIVPTAGGALLGAVVGVVFFGDRFEGDDEGREVAFGAMGGAALGFLIGSIVCGWLLSRREALSAGVGVLISLWMPSGIIAASLVDPAASQAGMGMLTPISCVVVWLILLFAISVAGKRERVYRLAAVAFAVSVPVLGFMIGSLSEDGYRVAMFRDAQTPLALVDEAALAELLPGWAVEEVRPAIPSSFYSTVITMTTGNGGEAELRMRTRDFRCAASNECQDLEPLADGSRVVWVSGFGCRDDIERAGWLVVIRPTGTWTAEPDAPCSDAQTQPSIDQLELVLQATSAVSPAEWVEREDER